MDSGVSLLRRAAELTDDAALGTAGLRFVNSLAVKGRPREAVPYQRRLIEELEAAGTTRPSPSPTW